MENRPHPEQGYRSCLGLLRLGQRYSDERLETACGRALTINSLSYKSVNSILEKGLDKLPAPEPLEMTPIRHCNLRGAKYFGEEGDPTLC